MRMFVAVIPPVPVIEELEEFLAVRRDADRSLRWALPEQWHLTLAFLPAVPERAYDDVCERLGATNDGQRAGAIELALEGLYLARKVSKETGGGETIYG